MKYGRINIRFSDGRVNGLIKKKPKRRIYGNCISWYFSKTEYKLSTGNRSLLKMRHMLSKT